VRSFLSAVCAALLALLAVAFVNSATDSDGAIFKRENCWVVHIETADHDYSKNVWRNSKGDAVGYSKTEDSVIYNLKECI
jgi:hypothetical protein